MVSETITLTREVFNRGPRPVTRGWFHFFAALASVIDPPTTGAIAPRRADKAPAVLDQRSLGRLMSEASGERRR